jgi:hypothetical protein
MFIILWSITTVICGILVTSHNTFDFFTLFVMKANILIWFVFVLWHLVFSSEYE